MLTILAHAFFDSALLCFNVTNNLTIVSSNVKCYIQDFMVDDKQYQAIELTTLATKKKDYLVIKSQSVETLKEIVGCFNDEETRNSMIEELTYISISIMNEIVKSI